VKKFIAGFVACLLLTAGMTVFAAEYKIIPNPYPILVNGQAQNIEAYNIDGATYVKLSKVGMATGSLVEFNTEKQQIEITTPTSESAQNKAEEDIKMDTQNSVDTSEWITLRDFATIYGHKVTYGPSKAIIIKSQDAVLEISLVDVGRDGPERIQTEQGPVTVWLKDSYTYLKISDLQDIGLIPQ
jgi:hypothetical protein